MESSDRMDPAVLQALQRGVVIPAHPLALTANRKLDERRQVALTRYYCDAGAGGVAVGVHTTQFAIRDPRVGLYAPGAAPGGRRGGGVRARQREAHREGGRSLRRLRAQAVGEAATARETGYDLGLLSLAALPDGIGRRTAGALPRGRRRRSRSADSISSRRWAAACCPTSSGASSAAFRPWWPIKVAPFNRYQTLDVVRAVADSGRAARNRALYGERRQHHRRPGDGVSRGGPVSALSRRIAGAVGSVDAPRRAVAGNGPRGRDIGGAGTAAILAGSAALTDANGALFDVRNRFAGCIAGLHEILRRQGLLAGRWCLDPAEDVSDGQLEEIDRVCAAYPELTDDEFVRENVDRWLR